MFSHIYIYIFTPLTPAIPIPSPQNTLSHVKRKDFLLPRFLLPFALSHAQTRNTSLGSSTIPSDPLPTSLLHSYSILSLFTRLDEDCRSHLGE